jgi:hypothetical protein
MQVSRRTVLKGIAAAIMAPTIQLRASVPDERLMLAFCDPDCSRWAIDAPFGWGSLTYATDTRAMIRAEIANRQEVGERKLPPKIDQIWESWFRPAQQWRQLTPDDIQPTIADGIGMCFECGDRRVSYGDEYPDLNEWGYFTDERCGRLGYDIDDNTIRDESCPTCKGLAYGHKNITVICGQEHQSHNLKRILALPNAMVCPSELHMDKHAPGLLFRADGFEGIALGLAPKDEHGSRW